MSSSYFETLPQKRMGAGCLIYDDAGRLLLVKPGYKPGWEIPGEIVERIESPLVCCQREVEEEIGLTLWAGRLLVVDYNAATEVKTESLMFIFDGGQLSATEIARIRLHPDELVGYDFFEPDRLPAEMSASLQQRVMAAWRQLGQGGSAYLENQQIISG